MKRREAIQFLCRLGAVSLATGLPAPSAHAIVVYDPSNFAQNIIQAIRHLQSNINEARAIANQVTSLANEAKNLAAFPWDIVNDFSGQFNRLFTVVGTINGLMQNVTNLQSHFEQLYPDFLKSWDPIDRKSLAEDMKRWLNSTRQTMLGAAKTGAQVLDGLPQSQAQLESLMRGSQGAVGILQATQAGNQIAGAIAGELMNLNAQLATYSQAHMSFLLELNTSAEASHNRMNHVLDGWTDQYVGKKLPENPF